MVPTGSDAMKLELCAGIASLWFLSVAHAHAQHDGDDGNQADDFAGEETTFEDEGTPPGVEEDPQAPTLARHRQAGAQSVSEPYPQVLAMRPVTLASGMARLSYFGGLGGLTEKRAYKARTDRGFARFGGVLAAAYGVSDQLELELSYGTGTASEAGYAVGKAVAVGARYRVTRFWAAQVEIPMLLNPFHLALTLGAPMHLRATDKLTFVVGEDLFTVRLTGMVPFVEDAVSNQAAVDALDIGTALDHGDITIKGGPIYQFSPTVAFRGTFGVIGADFSNIDMGLVLWGDLWYALTPRADLTVRAGFANLAEASDTATLAAGVAVRL
jgi:hypothetical protein